MLRNTLMKYTRWLLDKGYINHPTACIDYEISEEYWQNKASEKVKTANGFYRREKALHKQNVTKRALRGLKLWACVDENGCVDLSTLSDKRTDSIDKMLEHINPNLDWQWFKRKGWVCIKVSVGFQHGW